jgi:hypothetical protein
MFKRREQGWVSLNAFLEICNKISGFCNTWASGKGNLQMIKKLRIFY